MRKMVVLPLVLILAAISFLAIPLTAKNNVTLNASAMEISANQAPSKASIVPLSIADDPYETIETPIYTKENERVFYLAEVGILVTEDGRPIANEDGQNTLMTTYDTETENFIDGANRALSIYLDSRLEKHYLRSGGKYVTAISLEREIFLINFKPNNSTDRLIYAFREKVKQGFWDKLNPFNGGAEQYRYFDMNGQTIKQEHIGEISGAGWWKAGLTAYKIIGWPFTALMEMPDMSFADIREKTTLAELKTLMTHATQHPWDTITCGQTGLPVVTTDGVVIRVNPRTNQLVDHFGWALFNKTSGLPIVFYNNDIITTDGKQQEIQEAVLLNSITVNSLLSSGTDFYISSITTYFGTFDVPVFMRDGEWVLMTGESADGIINDTSLSTELDGDSLGEWWNKTFGGEGGSTFLTVLGLIAAAIILIILMPVIAPVLKLIALPITLAVNSVKRKAKERKDQKQNKD